ncbi:hypothetical protein D9611_010633 [Ephemerocybe angulata]|uniref:Uncharacterized protein n=1 Tax=Ephemerocybe angulata TaxID=980116 RepID=A0A8H5FAY4_9AGAR|nr:hypothetical protein D9611_010633 [Tulosesus angulatus]
MWPAKLGVPQILFILLRIYSFFYTGFSVAYYTSTTISGEGCLSPFYRDAFSSLITSSLCEAISYIRVYAFSGQNKILGAFLGLLFFATHAIQLTFLVIFARGSKFFSFPEHIHITGCITQEANDMWLSLVFISILVSLTTVTMIMITIACRRRQPSLTVNGLATVFYRDGISYFLVISGLAVVNIILGYIVPTCRMMHRVTKYRVVWLEALERICEQYGIFKPTFPMEEMSLLELEHASTGPTRFLNGVKMQEHEELVRPYLTRMPQLRQKRSSHDNSHYNAVHLVPGGRFLFTSGLNSVCLFDLGYNMNVPVKPFPLATLEGFGDLRAVAPTKNGKEFVIATLKRSVLSSAAQVNPAELAGQMKLNQTLSFVGDMHLTSTFTFFKCNEEFVLWNWAGNTGCRWPTSNALSPYTTQFYVFKDTILASGRNEEIYVYDLPTATSLFITDQARPVQLNDLESLTNEPKAFFPPPQDFGQHTVKFCAPSVWCENSPHDPHICLLYPNNETYYLRLYSVKPLKAPVSPFLPRSLPVPGGHKTKFYGDENSFSLYQALPSLFRCEDELVICTGSELGGLLISILPVPSKTILEEITPTNVVLVPSGCLVEDIERFQFAFCPMSGRAVYFGSSEMPDDVTCICPSCALYIDRQCMPRGALTAIIIVPAIPSPVMH